MKPFQQLTSIEEADAFIETNPLSFLYISRENCSVCHSLWPQVQKLLETLPQIELARIDAGEVEAVAGRFSIFTVPVLLLFVDGREFIREARIVHMQELEGKIQRILDALES